MGMGFAPTRLRHSLLHKTTLTTGRKYYEAREGSCIRMSRHRGHLELTEGA